MKTFIAIVDFFNFDLYVGFHKTVVGYVVDINNYYV